MGLEAVPLDADLEVGDGSVQAILPAVGGDPATPPSRSAWGAVRCRRPPGVDWSQCLRPQSAPAVTWEATASPPAASTAARTDCCQIGGTPPMAYTPRRAKLRRPSLARTRSMPRVIPSWRSCRIVMSPYCRAPSLATSRSTPTAGSVAPGCDRARQAIGSKSAPVEGGGSIPHLRMPSSMRAITVSITFARAYRLFSAAIGSHGANE